MIALIDNYDSFSYNLYQMIGALYPHIQVIRNDALSAREVLALHPQAIILSPGPGKPNQAGICEELVKKADGTPLLGVCLGHQAICEALGGRITHAKKLMHGKSSAATIVASCPLFAGLGTTMEVGRYHSLAADEMSLPQELHVVAKTDDGEIMAVQHVSQPLFGVQFHPESILTPQGFKLLANFLSIAGIQVNQQCS